MVSVNLAQAMKAPDRPEPFRPSRGPLASADLVVQLPMDRFMVQPLFTMSAWLKLTVPRCEI